MTTYTILKYIHIISAIVALGINLTYPLWFSQAKKKPDALAFILHTVKIIDDWIAVPAYVLLFPSGWWLASLAGWSLTTPWILTALILYIVLPVVGLGIFTPTLKKQIAIAESLGANAPEYKNIAFRSNAISIALNIIVLIIVYLMVAKPALWG
jgi:uncharacterized membrane protein